MKPKTHFGAVMGVLMLSGPVFAQDKPKPAPICAAVDAALPTDLASWLSRAKDAGSALVIGDAATVALQPIATVRFVVPPEKSGQSGTFGGSATFDVSAAGTYRIALGTAAWIDVVADGKTVASITHGHGPECSSIRKIVAFPLKPGRHILQFSGSQNTEIAVLVIPSQ